MPSRAKGLYRRIVPPSIRYAPWVMKSKSRLLRHDALYSADYYQLVESSALSSAGTIAASIVRDLKPKHVVDVGCGTGALLAALHDHGCEVLGLEYSKTALEYCRSRTLPVLRFDLEHDHLPDSRTFDVAISMEVAEHLPARSAERYLDILSQLSDVLVLTAAAPGQGGQDHVNKQPKSYWLDKLARRGYKPQPELVQQWLEVWKAAGTVAPWYYENLMIVKQ